MAVQVGGAARRPPTPEKAIRSYLAAEAASGRWPSVRALHARFGGSYSRLLRIRDDFAIEHAGALPPEERRRAKRSGGLSAASLAALGNHLKQALLATPMQLDPRQLNQVLGELEERIVGRVNDALSQRLYTAARTQATQAAAIGEFWPEAVEQAVAVAERLERAAARIGQLGDLTERSAGPHLAEGVAYSNLDATEIIEKALGRHGEEVKALHGGFLEHLGKEVSSEIDAMAAARRSVEQSLETLANHIPKLDEQAVAERLLKALQSAKTARSKPVTSPIPRLVQDLVAQALNDWSEPLTQEIRALRDQLAGRVAQRKKKRSAGHVKAKATEGPSRKRPRSAATKKTAGAARSTKRGALAKMQRAGPRKKTVRKIVRAGQGAKSTVAAAARPKRKSPKRSPGARHSAKARAPAVRTTRSMAQQRDRRKAH